ncbi:MAG TPA: helix-turn-helix transcriptional regulator [Bacilli bacterium]|nr:helix-turn-helix transcriptional regulator [Bacilli bacterium]
MRLIYTKPKLRDLSQGSRIAYVRQFRLLSQDDISNKLGLTGECKRRTMTRYEKGNRNPKDERTFEISKILNVNVNSIKKYDYSNMEDIIYTLMWLEELLPNYHIDLSDLPNINDKYITRIKKFIEEWNIIRNKRLRREISFEEYTEWKLNYVDKGLVSENE